MSEIRVITAGTLLDGTGGPPVSDGAVVIEEGKIVYAGPTAGTTLPEVAEDERLAAPDGTILPGLIDTHVHLTFNARSAMTAQAVIDQMTSDDDWMIAIRAVQAAQACLSVGLTTVRDCGAKGVVIMRLRDLIAQGILYGPRVLACGMPITTTAGHCYWCGLEANNEQEAIVAARRMAHEGADFIKVMATGGMMTARSNPMEPQFNASELGAMVREAHRLGRRLAAHSHATKGQQVCLEAGVDMIEHCNWLTPQGWEFDEQLMRQLVEAGTYIGHTIGGPQQQQARDNIAFDDLPPVMRDRWETLHEMRAMGAKVLIHTDAIAPITPYEGFPYAVVAAVRYGGFSVPEAIHACTGLSAEGIGIADSTGTLQAGKAADVLVVDGDIASDIAAITNTRHVLRDGTEVARKGWVRAKGSTMPGWDGVYRFPGG